MSLSRRELFGLLRRSPAGTAAVGSVAPDAPAVPDADRAGDGDGARTDADRAVDVRVDPPAAAAPPPIVEARGFSLDAFYAARTPERVIPAFAIRSPDAVPTTRVGLGRTPQTVAAGELATTPRDDGGRIASELVPRVLPHQCLATRSFCSVCVERCPIRGAIVVEHGRPRVVAELCDGCGHCIAACPAPVLAFQLVRREDKP